MSEEASDAGPEPDVESLLAAARSGDGEALGDLLAAVYGRLRRIARAHMARERKEHTLQPTALVHEAYLRVLGLRDVAWESPARFFAAAAEAMRRILVDHARRRGSQKRVGDRERVPLSVLDLAVDTDPDRVLALDEALERLTEAAPRAAEVVRLRFFAGLSEEEAAAVMGTSPRTVRRDWTFARAWLFDVLQEGR